MSKAYNSPTARLLQSSRLFSLPRPLPAAALETPSSTGLHRASDSATQFYPTHQAIATPSSSHYRGDWGLKRAIPGKTTRSSTPSIRVLGQDTSDHITEFESAADHERSRAKWAEMGVPIMARGKRDRGNNLSVYEDFLDNTDPNAAPVVLRSGADALEGPQTIEAKRWKHAGPFVAGMQEGEFQRYVERQLRGRRQEWNEHLMNYFAKQNFEQEKREAQENKEWHGPFETAGPWVQADMVLIEAENKADQLLQDALVHNNPELEAKARQEGELVMAEARQRSEEYMAEGKRWNAPEEARKVLSQAQRAAQVERTNIERLGDEITSREEGEERVLAIISDGIASVYRILGVEGASSSAVDITEANRVIREARAQVTEIQKERTRMLEEWEAQRIPQLRPTPAQLPALEKGLRHSHANLGSQLSKLITTFLDIPAVNTEIAGRNNSNTLRTSALHTELGSLGDNDFAPPTTHPAAGLSHLRTNAFMENHPVHGPQAYPSPVLSRVLMARSSAKSTSHQAQLGVGGFVALDPNGSEMGKNGRRNQNDDPAHILDPDLPGGNKVYVRPISASVDETGRVRLTVARADSEAVAVKEGNVEHIHAGRSSSGARGSSSLGSVNLLFSKSRQTANYGSGLPAFRRMAAADNGGNQQQGRRARIGGYDAEAAKLGGAAGSGQGTVEMLQQLSRGVRGEQQ
jgi:hypothetical protein